MSKSVADYLELSLAPSTARARLSSVRAYARFCIHFGHRFCPTPASSINEYATWLANQNIKASSISTYINAIRSFHQLRGFNDPISTKLQVFTLRALLSGIRRAQQYHPSSKPAITINELRSIRSILDWSDSQHRTFWAITVVGFWSFLRASNLMQKSPTSFIEGQHLSVDCLASTDFGITLRLQRTKTVQFAQRILTIPLVALPGDVLCPVQALIDMWELCPARDGSLFIYTSAHSQSSPLTHNVYNKLLRKFCKLARLPFQFSAHSLRKGGATCAFAAGVNDTMIKLQGDWVSDAYRRYVFVSMEQRLSVPAAIASRVNDPAYLARYVGLLMRFTNGLAHALV